jgi:hypothetical protein
MNVSGGDSADERTSRGSEPPAFPQVGNSEATDSGTAPSAPLFSPAGPPGSGAQMSDVVSRPIDPAPKNVGAARGGRVRWLVAGLATLLVFAVVGGVLFLAAPRAGTPSATAHYVPADTTAYAEIRLDLPGDQHDNLASFMSHFPGFADQAAFQQKLDESLNSLVIRSNGAGIDWNNDVKPWFGGQVAVFGNPNSNPGMVELDSYVAPPPPEIVFAFTVADKAKLQATIDARSGGSQAASVDYQGQQIKTIAQPAGMSTSGSYVITDDAILVAPTVELLKAALDVKAGQKPGLADQDFFLQQLASLHADRLATFYFDGSKQVSNLQGLTGSTEMAVPAECTRLYSSMGSVKYVGEARAESDHIALNMRSSLPTGDNAPPVPGNGTTTLAQSMPSDTLFYLETHNLGASLGWGIKGYLACMSAMQASFGGPSPSTGIGANDPSKLFEQFLDVKPEEFLNFVDDAALSVTFKDDKVGAGMVATVDDEAVATSRVNKLLGLLNLLGSGFGGSSMSMNIATDESDHNGTKVTTITLSSSYPASESTPITFQVAVANGRLYLGYENFVIDALDRQASDSLSTSAKYQKGLSAAPGDNASIFYADIAAIADLAEGAMSGQEKTQYEANSKPFIDPLSFFSGVSHVDGDITVSNGFLYVE